MDQIEVTDFYSIGESVSVMVILYDACLEISVHQSVCVRSLGMGKYPKVISRC